MRRIAAGVLCVAAFSHRVAAQRVSLETLAGIELWKTDDSSRLVARNNGRAAIDASVHAWFALRATSSLQLLALAHARAGTADADHSEAELELLELRFAPSRALTIDGGRILYPMGAFGARRFANTNPLVGAPDLYPTQYPWGVVVSGAAGMLDYRAALVSLPLVNLRYTPAPGEKLRPVIAAGVRAGPSFHFGAGVTRGAYLGPDISAQLPTGISWESFRQTIVATDARFSAGLLEARAEAAWSSYEVPTVKEPVKGFGWYGEVRATLSPRVFVAARWENFLYPFVLPVSQFFWVGVATRQMNGEVGAGYRLSPDALLKASLRRDHWPVHTTPDGTRFPDGYALALQFSLHSDVIGLLQGKY